MPMRLLFAAKVMLEPGLDPARPVGIARIEINSRRKFGSLKPRPLHLNGMSQVNLKDVGPFVREHPKSPGGETQGLFTLCL